ncbi:type II toxin-antitoxin system HicB family antitoxin [Burkholderia diffusa]|uniref:type II toxin-antitoxin system HicB family antitoxin n=1 Tax=Burkholderia diffusa TaxID=488732 RepID=UPI001E355CCE|nr:type II toxin-antitoxin system HicB family antitoxin [Burkholderia diffusa]
MTVPDIPGVHSWGETMGEAIENTKVAIASHVETLLALGEGGTSPVRPWKNSQRTPTTPERSGRMSRLSFLGKPNPQSARYRL